MIETERLKLIPLNHQQVELLKQKPKVLAQLLGTTYQPFQHAPETINDHIEAIEFWLHNTKLNPANFEWFTNWEIILKSENVTIGGIGFTGTPDELGETEVGYGIDIRYFNKGFATEALAAIMQWAFKHEKLSAIKANTLINHIASQKVLIKNGFERVDVQTGLIAWLAIKPKEFDE
ncbi:MAG: GNAT family N-acetyltransferase [Bacteroidia bacterium]|nr:GNAT family N-acetyltransferase [Bacteroidia bacterium]MBP9687963.1 GNAT family N-acetyltransferase [Bacteroidia bacterium]MBP9687992.1 GNAT family N-acetyltransferase [Bacteroidia bacterium]